MLLLNKLLSIFFLNISEKLDLQMISNLQINLHYYS